MYEKELSVAIQLAKNAGNAIMEYFDRDKGVTVKEDKTFLTKADVKSNEIILKGLRENFPEDGIISEELDDVEGERKWHVDPMDGTAHFVRGSKGFAVHIGLCVDNIPVLGVVYAPALDKLYYAVEGQGAFKEIKGERMPLKINSGKSNKIQVIRSRLEWRTNDLRGRLRILGDCEVLESDSTGLRMLALADNEADLFVPTDRNFKSWDICAPQAILKEAGGHLSYFDGESLEYNPYLKNSKNIVGAKNKKLFLNLKENLVYVFYDNPIISDLDMIEESVNTGKAELITGTLSRAKNYIVDTPSGKIFYKKYGRGLGSVRDAAKDAKISNSEEFNKKVYTLPAISNIEYDALLQDKVASEAMASVRWKKLGLPSKELLYYDGDLVLIFRHMNGYSFEKVLNGPPNPEAFGRVLDCWQRIRKKAKENDDEKILHSDPYANNFFYDEERDLVVPFDSSKINKKGMDFDEIDARLNLFFLCKIFYLKTDWDTKVAYVRQTTESFSEEERKLMKELYIDTAETREYLEKLNLPEDNVIDIYFRKDVRDIIQEALSGQG
jgi:3'(2'), 5'-bisphosphate nucleotidase